MTELHNYVTELLERRIVGQASAVRLIADVIAANSMSYIATKPLATFLFVGGIGLGRSTVAKSLAEILFNDANAYEAAMVGDPLETALIEVLSRRPVVALLRSIGHLHTQHERLQIGNILRQIRGGTILKTADGRNIDFKGSILIMSLTANLPKTLQESGGGEEQCHLIKWLSEQCNEQYDRRFLESVDCIVPFKEFDENAKIKLARLKIAELVKRQAGLGRTLLVDPEVAVIVAIRADATSGAMGIERSITNLLGTALARLIVDATVQKKPFKYIQIGLTSGQIALSLE